MCSMTTLSGCSTLQCFDWLEFFAGAANLTSSIRIRGGKGVKFDLLYNEDPGLRSSNFMDLCSNSGFWLLICKSVGLLASKNIKHDCSHTKFGNHLPPESYPGQLRGLVRREVFKLLQHEQGHQRQICLKQCGI